MRMMRTKLGWVKAYLSQKFFMPSSPVQLNPKEFFRSERRSHLERCYGKKVIKGGNNN